MCVYMLYTVASACLNYCLILTQALDDAKDDTFARLPNLKFCECFQLKHKFVFQETKTKDTNLWCLPLEPLHEGSILVWWVQSIKVANRVRFEPVCGQVEPTLHALAVEDMKTDYNICTIRFRSWLWHYQLDAVSALKYKTGICLWRVTPNLDLITLMLRNAFWTFPRHTVCEYNKLYIHADVKPEMSLLQVIRACIAKGLAPIPEEEVLGYLLQRFAADTIDASFAPALLEIDEACECLDDSDQKILHAEQKRKKESGQPGKVTWQSSARCGENCGSNATRRSQRPRAEARQRQRQEAKARPVTTH